MSVGTRLSVSQKSGFGSRSKSTKDSEMREQYLFLLEFFVHSISGDRLAKLNQMFFVPTSVCFEFLTFKDNSVEVTPVDPMFEPQAGIADEIEYFYSGRSVLFAIAEDVVLNKISEFNVGVIVEKKMPDNIKPNVLIGVSSIDLSREFNQLKIDVQRSNGDKVIPLPKSREGEYPVVFNGKQVGEISVYTRLSAFGQTIVTEFDAPLINGSDKQSTFLFRGDEIGDKSIAYKCRMIDSSNIDICKESDDRLELGTTCPVCIPTQQTCLPCGLAHGAVARPTTPSKNCDEQKSANIIQSSRGISQPCGKGVVLKVSGLLNVGEKGKQPTVTVVPESEATGPNNPPDDEHDVFILRIGKKGLVAAGEKSDIQLEMRTPKGPERRPPIRYETREAQTDSDKGGKGKGKGKGKTGKK